MDAIPKITIRLLEETAREAATRTYSPYSHFPVGAAVLAASGKIYGGCNVENASYGLTICAERTAIFRAIAAGEKSISAIAVYTPTKKLGAPCGACRQVINEFGPDCLVICLCDTGRRETRLSALLPEAFGPEDLT